MTVAYSRGPFLAAMFRLVFWILFWGPWWSTFVGIRGAPRLTEACPRHEDKARLTGTRIYFILLLGSLSNDWWTLWCLLDLQKYCCLSKLRQFWQKKVTAESHLRSCKTLALDSKKWSSSVALKNWWSNNPQLWSTCVMRRPFCVKVWWEDVQRTEPPWTYSYSNIFKPILEQCMCRWTVRKPFLSL